MDRSLWQMPAEEAFGDDAPVASEDYRALSRDPNAFDRLDLIARFTLATRDDDTAPWRDAGRAAG